MSQTENTINTSQNPEPPQPDPALKRGSRVALWKYGAARVVLFIVLTAVIQLLAMAVLGTFPLLVSALLALFVALPLSMLIFSKQRVEATEALAQFKAQRQARKDWIEGERAQR